MKFQITVPIMLIGVYAWKGLDDSMSDCHASGYSYEDDLHDYHEQHENIDDWENSKYNYDHQKWENEADSSKTVHLAPTTLVKNHTTTISVNSSANSSHDKKTRMRTTSSSSSSTHISTSSTPSSTSIATSLTSSSASSSSMTTDSPMPTGVPKEGSSQSLTISLVLLCMNIFILTVFLQ